MEFRKYFLTLIDEPWLVFFIDKSLIYHSTHTFLDHTMGQADVSLGVMQLYQKDLAEQC